VTTRLSCPFPHSVPSGRTGYTVLFLSSPDLFWGKTGMDITLSCLFPHLFPFREDRKGYYTVLSRSSPDLFRGRQGWILHCPVPFLTCFLSGRTGVDTTLSCPFSHLIPFGEDRGGYYIVLSFSSPGSFRGGQDGYYIVLSLSLPGSFRGGQGRYYIVLSLSSPGSFRGGQGRYYNVLSLSSPGFFRRGQG
jgi:hypothetical protein